MSEKPESFWWFEFLEPQGQHNAAMSAPHRGLLRRFAELETDGWKPEILKCALWRFLRRPDNFRGVDSMWELFLSQLKIWYAVGISEFRYREAHDGDLREFDEDWKQDENFEDSYNEMVREILDKKSQSGISPTGPVGETS